MADRKAGGDIAGIVAAVAGIISAVTPIVNDAMEKRKDKVKPMIYWGLTAVCVLLVIFPGWLPFIPSWLVRTAGVIGAVFCVLTALAAGLKIYNRTSGGEVKRYKTKKFISRNTK